MYLVPSDWVKSVINWYCQMGLFVWNSTGETREGVGMGRRETMGIRGLGFVRKISQFIVCFLAQSTSINVSAF